MNLDSESMMYMLAYELYSFNNISGYELIGVLPERRKNLMRITGDLKPSVRTSAIISASTENFQVKDGISNYNWKHALGI